MERSRNPLGGALALVLVVASLGAASAQDGLGPAPLPVDVPPTVATPGTPAGGDAEPAQTASLDFQRVFIDTGVSDVRVGDTFTVATLNRSPQSGCASNQYIYERDRSKWQVETGRLLVAMKEGATVRISFTCRGGYQSINAIQFLSPPPAAVATRAAPRRDQSVEAFAARQRFPLPGSDTADGRTRTVPLP